MKQLGYMWVLILIYFICSAKGCKEELSYRENKKADLVLEMKDSIADLFQTIVPGELYLRSFEVTAQQKLIDFADFLKIVSDTSLEESFRKQAFEMAMKLFISGENKTESWCKIYSIPEIETIEKLLNKSLSQGMSISTEPVLISVSKPLTLLNDSVYTGNLTFYQKYVLISNPVDVDTIKKLLSINVYAIRELKTFGHEQIRIWNINLGDFDQGSESN